MDDILLLLRNDAANVVCENLLDGKCDGLHDVLVKVLLNIGLVEPVVTDEFALAVADLDLDDSYVKRLHRQPEWGSALANKNRWDSHTNSAHRPCTWQ